MTAFEIRVNGELVATIGAGEAGSLTAAVTWSGEWWRWFQGEECAVRLEGRDPAGGELRWAAPAVHVGDEVSIRLVQGEAVDPPSAAVELPAADGRGAGLEA